MRIDRALNLVFPVDTAAGTVHVHATPIAREVFRKYFDVIGQTVAQIHARGLNVIAGPNIASLMLRQVAESIPSAREPGKTAWDEMDGVKNGLVAEIHRLANVAIATPQGWQTIPFVEAARRDLFSEEEFDAIEGGIVFFTCLSAIHGWQRERLLAVLTVSGIPRLWSGQVTSSNSTEFAASLPISTETGNSGAKAPT